MNGYDDTQRLEANRVKYAIHTRHFLAPKKASTSCLQGELPTDPSGELVGGESTVRIGGGIRLVGAQRLSCP
jgi:hypothetical protein